MQPEFTRPEFIENNSAEEIHQRMMNNLPADIDDMPGGFPFDFTMPAALEKDEFINSHTAREKVKEYRHFQPPHFIVWYKSGTEWRKKHLPALRLSHLPGQRPPPSRSDSTGNRPPLPRQNDRIRHFPAQPIISPLNRIKRFPAPVSAPQAYYDCCHSHM